MSYGKVQENYTTILKNCAKKKDLYTGSRLHADLLRSGLLKKSPYLASSLINMYAKCGVLEVAQEVFEEYPNHSVGSWSVLIGGYGEDGKGQEALNRFRRMHCEGICPDAITFTCSLRACGKTKAIDQGKKIHSGIISKGMLAKDVMLGSALLDMYVKCGLLAEAQQVLEELPIRNTISWSSLISGYVEQGQGYNALACFEQMQSEGLSPDAITFTCILKACGIARIIEKGQQIHHEIVNSGLLKKDSVLRNALVDMYAKMGMFVKAEEVLKEMPVQDIVSWNALISGYAEQGLVREALNCFECLQRNGMCPNVTTFLSILNACGFIGDRDKCEQIHKNVINSGLLGKDILIGNAIVDMYGKCGMLSKAQEVFEGLPERDIVSWNSLIAGYIQEGYAYEAMNFFEEIQNDGLSPDIVTFICILKACGITQDIEKGKQIHEQILNNGFLAKDDVLGSALVDMYVKCGVLAKAKEVLIELPMRNVITWSALITGYTQHGEGHEALKCYEQVQSEGFSPDVVLYIAILKACASIGAIEKGENIHNIISCMGLLNDDIMLGTALVDMYAKCGLLVKAYRVLRELSVRNTVSWNALLSGYAQHGQGYEALLLFKSMRNDGVYPNTVTFLCILSALSHTGLFDEAQTLFEDMTRKYGFSPNLEHYTCMVAFFGSAGYFDKAISVIKAMPSFDYSVVWLSLLGPCRKWLNVKLGSLAFDQTIQLDSNCATAYAIMAGIFTDVEMQEDAEKVENMRLMIVGRDDIAYGEL